MEADTGAPPTSNPSVDTPTVTEPSSKDPSSVSAAATASGVEGELAVESAAAADAEDVGDAPAPGTAITHEGLTASSLDPAIELRLQRAKRLAAENLDEAAEELAELMKEAADRYGELCQLVAPIYVQYGYALLKIAQKKSDALGGAAAEKPEDGSEDDEEAAAAAAGSASAVVAAAPEEDLSAEDDDKADDDATIAFECLDTARVIYSRKENKSREDSLEIARVHMLLGDALSEMEKFAEALEEYKTALTLRTQLELEPQDRRICEVLTALGECNLQLASEKNVGEKDRRVLLSQTLINFQAAAESMCMRLRDAAVSAGHAAFVEALEAEVGAGALTEQYKPGVTTTLLQDGGSSSSAAAAAAGSKEAVGLAEPEIRVFSTLAQQHWPRGSAVSSSSSSAAATSSRLADADAHKTCELIDYVLQRMSDIQQDLGISVSRILAEVSAASGSGGTTTIGFGSAPSSSSSSAASSTAAPANGVVTEGFGFGAAARDAAVASAATTLLVRRRPGDAASAASAAAAPAAASASAAPAAASAAAAAPTAPAAAPAAAAAPTAPAAAPAAAAAAPTASAAAAAPTAGEKRVREDPILDFRINGGTDNNGAGHTASSAPDGAPAAAASVVDEAEQPEAKAPRVE